MRRREPLEKIEYPLARTAPPGEQRQGGQDRRGGPAKTHPKPGSGVELVQITTSRPS